MNNQILRCRYLAKSSFQLQFRTADEILRLKLTLEVEFDGKLSKMTEGFKTIVQTTEIFTF